MSGGINFFTASPSYFGGNITTAVNNGSLSIERINDMAHRIMTPYFYLKQDAGFPPVYGYTPRLAFYPKANWVTNFTLGPIVDVHREGTAALIRELGAAGTVLLKNTNATIPRKRPMDIGMFGNDAADLTHDQYSLTSLALGGTYDIGTMPVGGGSGTGRFTYLVSPLEAIKARVQSYGALVQYITDNAFITSGMGLPTLAPRLLDVCLVFPKDWATEGFDRTSLLARWNSTVLVESVAAVYPNTVVVLHGGAPNTMPW